MGIDSSLPAMQDKMWILLLFLGTVLAWEDCSEYTANKCTGDPYAEIIAFNAGSQEKCQAHCELFSNCKFYAFHTLMSQGVDCHLFDEPFSAYINHCKERGGPWVPKQEQGGPCFSPEENSCEVAQYGNCNMMGKIEETFDNTPYEKTCEKICSLNSVCKFWVHSSETNECHLYDSAEKKCNVAFGPRDGTPDECAGPDPTRSTNRPTEPTVTPPPDCDIDCPAQGLALFPDCENCGRFYECFNGALTSRECPYCNHFDPDKGYCNQPPTVDCGDRPVPDPDDCHACDNPPPCRCPQGYFPDPWSCGQYYYCQDNSPDPYSCQNDTFSGLYNDKLIQCDFPERVQCEDRPICRGPSRTKCQCQGAVIKPPVTCKGTSGITLEADPYNCQHFLVCMGGELAEDIYCPDGQYLPEGGQECVAGDGSQCGKRPVCEEIQKSEKCVCK